MQVIESITSHRELQPEFEAMYLLMPTNQNVDRIIRDFTEKKQYAAAHLFFIEGLFHVSVLLSRSEGYIWVFHRTCGTVIPKVDVVASRTTFTSFERTFH